MERVDEDRAAMVVFWAERESQEEVPGEVDAVDPHAGPPRDLDVDHGKRARNSGATFEHLVQKAVSGVLVIGAVSCESFLVEQIAVERIDRAVWCIGTVLVRQPGGGRFAHVLQVGQVGLWVKPRVGKARDEQGWRRQVRVWTGRGLAECLDQFRREQVRGAHAFRQTCWTALISRWSMEASTVWAPRRASAG